MSAQELPKSPRRRMTVGERSARPSFQDRIYQRAKELEQKASQMAHGPERDALLRLARRMNVKDNFVTLLTSPGLQPK